MLSDSTIQLDRPIYYPGELVTGSVSIPLVEPIAARFLKISWRGQACTYFNECVKVYLDGYTMAWQSTYGDHQLPAGTHNFPFSFLLPSDCPPNIFGLNGDIRYRVKVELDRPWRFNQTAKKAFNVAMGTRKTPIEKNFMKPCRYQNHRNSGAICSDGVFSMNVRLEKRVFARGETLQALVELHNNTSKPIVNLHCDLLTQSHYHFRPQSFQCSISDVRNCPLQRKHRREEERVIQKGDYPLNVRPYHSLVVKVEVELNVTPSFESDMISLGYLWCFTAMTNSLTGNELSCNARIIVVPEKVKEVKNKKTSLVAKAIGMCRQTDAPPPYSPKDNN